MESKQYLKENPIVKSFLDQIYEMYRSHYYAIPHYNFEDDHWENPDDLWERRKYDSIPKIRVTQEFIVITIGYKRSGHIWGFIARDDGVLNGYSYKKGDLLASDEKYGKHPVGEDCGNIFDDTAKWDMFGPYDKDSDYYRF
jgi:hypothetical protein